MTTVIANCQIDVVDDEVKIREANSPLGKSFLQLTFPSGEVLCITTNLAEMIGGAGKGLRLRREDAARHSH